MYKYIDNFYTEHPDWQEHPDWPTVIAPPFPHFILNFNSQRPWFLGGLDFRVSLAFPFLQDNLVIL